MAIWSLMDKPKPRGLMAMVKPSNKKPVAPMRLMKEKHPSGYKGVKSLAFPETKSKGAKHG